MTYPYWLKKMLAEAGLGNWIPGAANLFPCPSTTLATCSDRILQTNFESIAFGNASQVPPSLDYLDLSSDQIQGMGMPVQTLPRSLSNQSYSPIEGLNETREAVSNYLDVEYAARFDVKKELLITQGSRHAIQIALEAFVNPGDKVLLPDPCPPHHEQLVRNHGAIPIWITLRQEDGKHIYSERELQRQMRSSRATLLSSPANPTGGIFDQEDFQKLGCAAVKNKCLIIWDTSLLGLQLDGKLIHPGSFEETRKISLCAGSLSLSHGIAAARIGWLGGAENLIAPCRVLLKMQGGSPSIISQQILTETMRNSESEERHKFLGRLQKNRDQCYNSMASMGFDPLWPAGGPYLWIPIWRRDIDTSLFTKELEFNYKLLIKQGNTFGHSGIGYARITFGVDEGRLDEALRRLTLFIEKKPLVAPGLAFNFGMDRKAA